jgi:hypothetical protein
MPGDHYPSHLIFLFLCTEIFIWTSVAFKNFSFGRKSTAHYTLWSKKHLAVLMDFAEVYLLQGHLNALNQIHRIWKFNILYWKKSCMYVSVLRFCVSEQASMTAETGRYSSVQVTAPFKTSMFDTYYTWPSIFRSGYDSWNYFRLKVCRMLIYFLCAARNLWLTICSAFDDTHADTNLY